MDVSEFEDKYVDKDCGEAGGEGCKTVDSETILDGKYITYSTVYAVGTQFFCVDITRSNSGYWGDSELESVEVYEVESIVKTINAWQAI